jgi:hypothetical protein
MITNKQWSSSGKDFHKFVSGHDYPECYKKTMAVNMPEPVEIDEDIFMYFMEVLPPFFITGGFQCSEPVYSGSFDTFTEKDGVYCYHGHGPRGGKWLPQVLKKSSEMPSELSNRICSLLIDSGEMKQQYAATELAFTLSHLRGETGLQEAFSSESLRIITEFYKKEGYSFDL